MNSLLPLSRGALSLLSVTIGLLFATLPAKGQTQRVSDIDRRIAPRTQFQKPIAWEVGDHTFLFEGTSLAGTQYLFDFDPGTPGIGRDHFDLYYAGVYDLRISRKMANTLTYGVNTRLLTSGIAGSEATEGRFDVYLRGIWGQVSYGDFDDRDTLVLSARNSLAGEANLFYDGFVNTSPSRAFRYRARYSSFLVDAAVDDDGRNYNAGFLYRSPHETVKRAWSFDYHGGDLYGRYARNGVTFGHMLTYGSWDITAGVSWDHLDPYAGFNSFDRISGSIGTGYKWGRTAVGAGLLVAETGGGDLEYGATAGFRYDFSRGFSFNAGYLYLDSNSLGTDGLPVTAGQLSGIRTSFSYRF